ncbi:MAG: nitrite/sulfite reductase, partial [Methylobacteriaceae bacterium]|nr:nitrite/sulfite reductase [Methylobacteriaceae bacterium]
MFYKIPDNFLSELDELEGFITAFQQGTLDEAALKARRVPFGCYEQREEGTYMLRIRTPGGAVTPQQLRTIARISKEQNGPFVHVTTRQEFQLHDIKLENVVGVMRQLAAAGLSTRGGGGNTVRNILLSADAGIAPDEVFDPGPYVFSLTSRLIAQGDSWVLPRKFKISFSNSDTDTAHAKFNDLGFIASVKDGKKGFRVYVAGGLGAKSEQGHLFHDFIPLEDVYQTTEAV